MERASAHTRFTLHTLTPPPSPLPTVPRFVGPRRNARAAIFMAEQRKLAIIRRQPSFNPLHLRHTHASGRSPTMTADAPSTSAEQMGGTPSHAACHSTTRDHTPTSDGGFAGRLNTRSSTSRQSVRAVLCRSSYVLATAPPPKTTTRAAQRSSGRHSEGSSTWRRRCWLLMGRVPMRPRHGSVSFPRLGARTATRLPLLTARASAAGSVRRWLTGFAPTTSLSP